MNKSTFINPQKKKIECSISIGNNDFVNFLRMEPELKYLLRLSHFIDLPWEASDRASDDFEPVCETLSMFK